MKRLAILLSVMLAVSLTAFSPAEQPSTKLKYRSFCYDDWLCEFMVNPSPLEPKYLDMLVDEVAAGGADVFVMNPNGQTTSHPSKVWQTMWKAYAAGDRKATFGSVPKRVIPANEIMLKDYMRLVELKIDFLAYTFAACRKRGVATGASIRMNDQHFTWYPGRNYMVSDFWIDNPQLRIPKSKCFNYEHNEVRQYFMKLIVEMIDDYDIDVLDLDFMRNPEYFPGGNPDKNCSIMTSFIADVHKHIKQSGKSIALMVRVPQSLAIAKSKGLDVADWTRCGLVDGVVLCGFLHSPWRASMPQARQALGPKVAVYVSGDWFADTREKLPDRHLGLHAELMRGFAAGHLAAGADGIYWFNFVPLREAYCRMRLAGTDLIVKPPHRDASRPCFETIGECNSLENLQGKTKTYLVDNSTRIKTKFDAPPQLPFSLKPETEHAFHFLAVAEPRADSVQVVVEFRSEKPVDDLVLMRFNDKKPMGKTVYATGPKDARTARFSVSPESLRSGPNRLVFRGGSSSIRVVGLEIQVKAEGLAR